MKRLVDIVCSFAGLVVLVPLVPVVALLIKLDSPGPVFFRHMRVGRGFRPLRVYKFRTMRDGAEQTGAPVTSGSDPRITRIGHLLRRTKIDELPQLLNVLKGEMSLVGPRPEVREYVDLFKDDYRKLLAVRPGITDPASLHYAREEAVLARSPQWEEEYRTRILPQKIRLSLRYIEQQTVLRDLSLILRTVLRMLRSGDKQQWEPEQGR